MEKKHPEESNIWDIELYHDNNKIDNLYDGIKESLHETVTYNYYNDKNRVYMCEKIIKKKSCIHENDLSKFLIFQLKRFTYEKNQAQKINHHIEIPQKLTSVDLFIKNPILSHDFLCKYVIFHQGENTNEGHYVALALINKNWYLFDDKQVTMRSGSLTDIIHLVEFQYGCCSYVIIYERNNKNIINLTSDNSKLVSIKKHFIPDFMKVAFKQNKEYIEAAIRYHKIDWNNNNGTENIRWMKWKDNLCLAQSLSNLWFQTFCSLDYETRLLFYNELNTISSLFLLLAHKVNTIEDLFDNIITYMYYDYDNNNFRQEFGKFTNTDPFIDQFKSTLSNSKVQYEKDGDIKCKENDWFFTTINYDFLINKNYLVFLRTVFAKTLGMNFIIKTHFEL